MTTLPDDVRRALEDDLAAVAAEDEHWLVLGRRVRLWRLMGQGPPARERRLRLMEFCVERVLPIWQRCFSDDDRPQQFLRIARQVAAGELDGGDAVEQSQTSAGEVTDELLAHQDAQAVLLASAALVTFATDLDLVEHAEAGADLALDDRGDDPDFTEADHWACDAAAFVSEEERDPDRQREFWEWYLREAIPRAWAEGGAAGS